MGSRLIAIAASAAVMASTCLDQHDGHPPPPQTITVITSPTSDPPTPPPIPASARIKVPYTIQAPGGKWDAAHEEYCEAAAIEMIGHYMRGDRREVIPPAEADADMSQIVAWERAQFPGVLDLDLNKVGIAGQHFVDRAPVIGPANLASVKAAIATGHPVVIPVMTHGAPGGDKISPHYGRQNVYHVILIVGYDSKYVYTNDAGFNEGENWPYDWSILESAMDAQQAKLGQGRIMLTFA